MCDSANSSKESLLKEIKDLDAYFYQLINLIPPKIYFKQNEEILENMETEKKRKFENSSLSAKSKNKRIKLDPNCQQRVSDVANEYLKKKKNGIKISKLRKKLAKRIKEINQNSSKSKLNESNKTEKNYSNEQINTKSIPKIFDNEGNLVFSKFDLASQMDLAAEKEIAKKNKKLPLKGLLVKTKRDEEKILKMEKINPEAAKKLKMEKMWKNALGKSEGNKVRDDPKLIAKSLNKKKKIKIKKGKAWAERKANVDKRKQFKQEKREKHLNDRKKKKKDKKMKRLQKKGHILI